MAEIDSMDLRVDKPKSGGSGTSNDGNIARRAFENTDFLSECLGSMPNCFTISKLF